MQKRYKYVVLILISMKSSAFNQIELAEGLLKLYNGLGNIFILYLKIIFLTF